jgi:hypothetical protein
MGRDSSSVSCGVLLSSIALCRVVSLLSVSSFGCVSSSSSSSCSSFSSTMGSSSSSSVRFRLLDSVVAGTRSLHNLYFSELIKQVVGVCINCSLN